MSLFSKYKNLLDYDGTWFRALGLDDERADIVEKLGGVKNPTRAEAAWKIPALPYHAQKLSSLGVNWTAAAGEQGRYLIAEAADRLKLSKRTESELDFEGFGLELHPYQKAGVEYILRAKRVLLADEMGCIDGEALVSLHRAGKGFKISLAEAFHKFHSPGWDKTIPTLARCLKNGELRLGRIKNILDKGVQPVLKLVLLSGKELRLTPDHEVCLGVNNWIAAQELRPGDLVLTNGIPVCLQCGSREQLSTYLYAKYRGYCRICIYRTKRNNRVGTGKFIDKDGYVRITRQYNHPRQCVKYQVYEHILVMEKHLGYSIKWPMQVHHKDGNRSNNSIENLELVTPSQHHIEHNKRLHLPMFHPKEDIVMSISTDGEAHVYDIVMDDEAHNFVANGIIVHNCGKTAQVLGLMYKDPTAYPVLIICPATLKYWWKQEGERCLPGKNFAVLDSKSKLLEIQLADVCIINYDLLAAGWETPEKKNIKLTPVGEMLLEHLFQAIICDEMHCLKNYAAQRTKAVKKLAEGKLIRIGITGTPVTNRPAELAPLLQILGRLNDVGGWLHFMRRYCSSKVNKFNQFGGSHHEIELNERMRSSFYLRRTKDDVKLELPPLTRSIIPVSINNRAEYLKAEHEFIAWVKEKAAEDEKFRKSIAHLPEETQRILIEEYKNDKAQRAKKAEAMIKVSALKRIVGKGKMHAAKLWIDDFLEADNKLLVFAIHQPILETLKDNYKHALLITSDMSAKERQESVESFQNNGCNILIGAMGNSAGSSPAGTGLTLTAASDLLTLELGWTSAHHDQIEGRSWRMGQEKPVTSYYLIGQNTVEHKILELLDSKREICNKITDGIETDSTPPLIDLLMEELARA